MYFDQLEGKWLVFKQILTQKSSDFDKLSEDLRQKLDGEEQGLTEKVVHMEKIWEEKKPYKGDLKPRVALDIISLIQDKLTQISDSYSNLNKAKDLMGLAQVDTSRIESRAEEASDYKEVWSAIAKVWTNVDGMYDTNLATCQPIKMIKSLEQVIQDMNALPNKLRNFDPFITKKEELKILQKQTKLINELRNESFKERHWAELLKKINLNKRYSELTVGQLWDYNLLKYERPIEEIVSQARGQYILEEEIKKIKTFWQAYALELVRF